MPKHLGKMPEPLPKLTKAEANARRKRLIEYYETTANRSKAQTARHFAKEIPPTSLYQILRVYERRKKEGWQGKLKFRTKKTLTTPEMIQKYAELYQMDPLITDMEAGQILNLKSRSSIMRLRNAFHGKLKCEENKGPNHQVLDSWCLGEKRIESEDVEPPPAPVKVKGRGRGRCNYNCLACFQQFDEIIIPVDGKVDQLKENLKMFFAFKHLLDMTSEEMEEIMRSSTGTKDPCVWAIFCEDCRSLVEEAMATFKEIRKLEEKLKGFRNELIERICNTSGLNFKSKNVKGFKYIKYAGTTKKVREMVCSKKGKIIPEPCDFSKGDNEAELKARVPIPHEIVVKQEIKDVMAPVDHVVEVSCESNLIKNEVGATDNQPEADCNENNAKLQSVPPELGPNLMDQFPLETNAVCRSTITNDINDPLESLPPDVMNINPGPVPMPTVSQGICDACGVEMRPFAIPMHKLMEHDIVMEGYTAKYCEKEGCNYKTLYDALFRKHVKVHSDNRPFNCSYCGKGFAKKAQFENHEEIHKNAETRPYQCDLCGSSFAVKTYLYLHKRMSHEKRFFPSTNRKRSKE